MILLGIETSCDETAAAVVRDGTDVCSSVVASQIEKHAGYGGVVPELAAREHLAALEPVAGAALHESGCAFDDLDAVAVTHAPGLIPALLVGVAYAKGLAVSCDIPLVGVNHFLAHIYGAFVGGDRLADPASYPLLSLVVSGGHTALLLIDADGSSRLVGTTLDDAAGEAFDKAAKILELGYPGGPIVDGLAAEGNPKAYDFPRGLTGGGGRPVRPEDRFNFSFSGVKTSLLYAVRDTMLGDQDLRDVAASYQQAIVDALVRKTVAAAQEFGAQTVCLCGGVACNRQLRADMAAACTGADLVIAEPRLCTDNAAMVAGLAFHYLKHGRVDGPDLAVSARLPADLGTIPFAPLAR